MTASWTNEEWRDVPGYEGRYQVNNLGRVRSLTRRVNCAYGRTRMVKGRVLTPIVSTKGNGYLCVTLDGKRGVVPIHHIVASAFLGPRPGGQDIRHLDDDKLNNRADNLAYGSRAENIRDVYRIGRAWKKLSAADVIEIRERIATGESHASIAKDYGVHKSTVSRIKRGVSHAWIE